MVSGNAQSFGRLSHTDSVAGKKLDWLKVLAWTAFIPGAWLVIGSIGWEAWRIFGA
jgi:hypothetical protein